MKKLLVRAEDKNIWERRAPIVPADLAEIIAQTGAAAYVEKSEKRFFKDADYAAAGAQLCTDMSAGDVIFGVKEIPEEKIVAHKTYVFFSHTIKGQPSGMPLLRKIMASGSTLIDYEKITDDQNRRLIFFGRYAGDAGAIDILSLMGEYWAHHGQQTPFENCKRAHEYASVADARSHMKAIGEQIKTRGLPQAISPLVIGIMGYGNVSGGAQQIIDCLPVERIDPADLNAFVQSGRGRRDRVYLTVFKEKDMVRRRDGQPFDLDDYYQHPEGYDSCFADYLPSITILVNAVYWESRYPRFVTWDSLKTLYRSSVPPKLCGIADISCDVNGAVECNVRSTGTEMPAYLCDPLTRSTTDGHRGDGIVLLAVDNLPCELPQDASVFFSRQLKNVVPSILSAEYDTRLADAGLCPEVEKAVIVYNGKLTPAYQYLEKYLS